MIKKLGGRKNIAFYVSLVTLIVLAGMKIIDGGQFIAGLSIIFGVFAGANVAGKFSG